MVRIIYNLLLILTFPAAMFYYAWRVFLSEKARDSWRGNFGALPKLALRPKGKKLIWIHAVSLGEVVAVTPLVNELHRRHPTYRLWSRQSLRQGVKLWNNGWPVWLTTVMPRSISPGPFPVSLSGCNPAFICSLKPNSGRISCGLCVGRECRLSS